jgi:tRNA-dihydrouridine synthase 1
MSGTERDNCCCMGDDNNQVLASSSSSCSTIPTMGPHSEHDVKTPFVTTAKSSTSSSPASPSSRRPVDYEDGWRLYRKLGSPKYVLAPLVDQSELAFRQLVRRYGCELCYSPMLHAQSFLNSKTYRDMNLVQAPEDRPLVMQFCGNDPDVLLRATRLVEHMCDAVDLNLGCPQKIARRGNYGAFLLNQSDLVCSIVSHLHQHLSIPVTCKIRLLPTWEETIALCRALQDAGCAILTVHGRTKEMNKHLVRENNFDMVRRIKEELKIPVFSNGGIATFEEVNRALEITGCDAIMSGEGILSNPAMFYGKDVPPLQLAREYVEFSKQFPYTLSSIKGHLFKILYPYVTHFTHLRPVLGQMMIPDIYTIVDTVEELDSTLTEEERNGSFKSLATWYYRHQNFALPAGARLSAEEEALIKATPEDDENVDVAGMFDDSDAEDD